MFLREEYQIHLYERAGVKVPRSTPKPLHIHPLYREFSGNQLEALANSSPAQKLTKKHKQWKTNLELMKDQAKNLNATLVKARRPSKFPVIDSVTPETSSVPDSTSADSQLPRKKGKRDGAEVVVSSSVRDSQSASRKRMDKSTETITRQPASFISTKPGSLARSKPVPSTITRPASGKSDPLVSNKSASSGTGNAKTPASLPSVYLKPSLLGQRLSEKAALPTRKTVPPATDQPTTTRSQPENTSSNGASRLGVVADGNDGQDSRTAPPMKRRLMEREAETVDLPTSSPGQLSD